MISRAAGTARGVRNRAERNRQVAAGSTPHAMTLNKPFNRIGYSDPDRPDLEGRPWRRTIHRGAHAQPCANLADAWSRYHVYDAFGVKPGDRMYLAPGQRVVFWSAQPPVGWTAAPLRRLVADPRAVRAAIRGSRVAAHAKEGGPSMT
ncbi:hypothetical protein [Massilia putida]|uniref:hypothetical protein n=1 Tax=Massilia putida TaxID=1141883 RepID=UPI00095316E7|nr:hypothetical protein [Massilia putida]